MTKDEFKNRWESDDDGGGITVEDIADCAKSWGLFSTPGTCDLQRVTYKVLRYVGVSDVEDYNPFSRNF